MELQNKLKYHKKSLIYTLPEYSKKEIKAQEEKKEISKNKLRNSRFRAYLQLISLFPQIRLVGFSGSISMMNATKNDDIDLFIISNKNRLFTARLIALFLSEMLGLRRERQAGGKYKDKVCLNLFFDEKDLKIPKVKKTLFVAHEILQMKPIINKSSTYERFLHENDWVFRLFPNAKTISTTSYKKRRNNKNSAFKNILDKIELLSKKMQLDLINKHRTTETIKDTQLWFHPDDFEKKLPPANRVG